MVLKSLAFLASKSALVSSGSSAREIPRFRADVLLYLERSVLVRKIFWLDSACFFLIIFTFLLIDDIVLLSKD